MKTMNNREIKFRTWDKQLKQFAEWTNRDPFFDTSHGQIFFWERVQREDGSYDGDIILQDYGDRFILQQYTGLKDRNGKDIYEGDILKWHEGENNLSEVIFLNGSFMVRGINWGAFWYLSDYYAAYTYFGNIFENSELINNEKL
jgi:uncharacterized phage protein (TIGR01671 family)